MVPWFIFGIVPECIFDGKRCEFCLCGAMYKSDSHVMRHIMESCSRLKSEVESLPKMECENCNKSFCHKIDFRFHSPHCLERMNLHAKFTKPLVKNPLKLACTNCDRTFYSSYQVQEMKRNKELTNIKKLKNNSNKLYFTDFNRSQTKQLEYHRLSFSKEYICNSSKMMEVPCILPVGSIFPVQKKYSKLNAPLIPPNQPKSVYSTDSRAKSDVIDLIKNSQKEEAF